MIAMLDDTEFVPSNLDLASSGGANYAERKARRDAYVQWIENVCRRLSDTHIPPTFNESSIARHNGRHFFT